MKNVGCIVMYSKPIDDNKTIPCGTVFYTDGTSDEVSLKEAANHALNMALEYGYVNAIENERYFNVTFEEFVNNREKYESIAKGVEEKEEIIDVYTNEHEVENKEESQTIKTKIDGDINDSNLPDFIRVVEPPAVVRDKTSEKVEEDEDIEQIEENIQKALEEIMREDEEKVPTQDDLNGLINEANAKSR